MYKMSIAEMYKKINTIYKITGKLNLYFSVCKIQKRERIKSDLEEIKKMVDELLPYI